MIHNIGREHAASSYTQALRYSYVMLGARREPRPRSQCVVGTRARYQIARTLAYITCVTCFLRRFWHPAAPLRTSCFALSLIYWPLQPTILNHSLSNL